MRVGSLLNKAKDKLEGSKFRWLNEKLYSMTSACALEYFGTNSELFLEYHQGFRRQVAQWPIDPVCLVIRQLDVLISKKSSDELVCIADMGCGEAKIYQHFQNRANVQVHSYDLVSMHPHVIECDISSVPLAPQTVDAVVFSLSLMGTNYMDFILEGFRVLKTTGHMHIVEVKSRFDGLDRFLATLAMFGLECVWRDENNTHFVYLIMRPAPGQTIKSVPTRTMKPSRTVLRPCKYKKR